jgi:hypothetical protein
VGGQKGVRVAVVTTLEQVHLAPDESEHRRLIAAAAFAIPPVAMVAVAFGLALRGGGVNPEQWEPVALGMILSLGCLAAVGAMPTLPRSAWLPLGALGAVVAWSALSLTWSLSPEQTFENVARLAMLAAAAVVGAAYAARPRAALSLSAALAACGALLALIIEAKLLTGSTGLFIGSRLSWPIDYANANAALLWLPLPPLLAFAAAEPLRPIVRSACGFLAALACAVGFTAQSRGGAIALVVALVASVAIARDRGRFLLTTVCCLAPVAPTLPSLATGQAAISAAVARDHGIAAAASAAGAAVLVLGLAMLDRRHRLPFGGRENKVAAALAAIIIVVGATAFVAKNGRPDTWLHARWDEFATAHPSSIIDASRFGTGTSNRYDYWTVAWHSFVDHPIVGVGSGAFSVPWFRARTLGENVTDPHSWEVEALAETGVVGFVLLGAALLIPLARIRSARRERGAWPIAAIALGGASVYFVVHASLDWLFRIPAIALPGFVAIGAIGTGGHAGRLKLANGRQRLGLAVGALIAAAAAVPVYASTAEVSRAESRAASSPHAAVDQLERAAWLNPFSVDPLIVRATVLESMGAPIRALKAAREATRKAPNDWRAWAALLASSKAVTTTQQERQTATRRLAALNPRAEPPRR